MSLIETLTIGAKNAQIILARNAPNLLTGTALVGLGTTAAFTGWGCIRANEIVRDHHAQLVCDWYEKGGESKGEPIPKLTTKDIVLLSYKPLIPAGISFICTAGCIILARTTSAAQTNAALAWGTVASQTLADVRQEMRNVLGEKKAKEIQDNVAQHYIDEKHPESTIMVTDEEAQVLCYEKPFNHEFKSSYEDIRAAVNTINEMFQSDVWISLNEFYYILGIPPIPLGYDLGWHRDNGYLAVDFSAGVNKQHKPCLVIDFRLDERISGNEFSKAKNIY